MVLEGSQGNWRHSATNVLVTLSQYDDEVNVRIRTLVTDWNYEPAGLQFNDYTCSLERIAGHWRIKLLIAIPTKIVV